MAESVAAVEGSCVCRRVRLAHRANRALGDLRFDGMLRARLDGLFGIRWVTRLERIDLDVTQVEFGEEAIHLAEPPER